MTRRPYKILLAEPDADTVEMLVAAFSDRLDAQITCVSGAEACLDVEMVNPHDVVIADMDLDDSNGLSLAEHLSALSSRPIILMAHEPSCENAIEALRLGVRDLLVKPFPLSELLTSVERTLRGHRLHREHSNKYHRMRKLVRRVLKERRELTQRMELICRDLVGAHRRLVDRVLANPEPNANEANS